MAATDSPCRIMVMASGFGSNFQALIDGVAARGIPNSRIVRLVTNRKNVQSIKRAEEAGIPHQYFNLISHGFVAKGETDKERIAEGRRKYDAALAELVLAADDGSSRPELIVLAGWMHVLSSAFLDPVEKAGIRVINLHPALPGEFDGAGAIERAYVELKAGRITRTGVMAHYVIQEVDKGEPILVREVPYYNGDSLEALEERMHACEHGLIVDATAKVVGEILESRSR